MVGATKVFNTTSSRRLRVQALRVDLRRQKAVPKRFRVHSLSRVRVKRRFLAHSPQADSLKRRDRLIRSVPRQGLPQAQVRPTRPPLFKLRRQSVQVELRLPSTRTRVAEL